MNTKDLARELSNLADEAKSDDVVVLREAAARLEALEELRVEVDRFNRCEGGNEQWGRIQKLLRALESSEKGE